MATEKSAEPKKDVEPKKDAATDEKSIEIIVEGMTEEELKRVSGGLSGALPAVPMKCGDMTCSPFRNPCYEYCQAVGCKGGFTCTDQLGCPGQSFAR